MKREVPKPDLELVFDHYGARIIGGDRGGWRKAECPLLAHEDSNPSASVNTDECRWRCFSCDKGGDAIDLILENEDDIGFPRAVAIAEGFTSDGDRQVRAGGAGSGLLSRPSGSKRSGGNWTPPWAGL